MNSYFVDTRQNFLNLKIDKTYKTSLFDLAYVLSVFSYLAKEDGLLSLEEMSENIDKHFGKSQFNQFVAYGINLIVDGFSPDTISEFLSTLYFRSTNALDKIYIFFTLRACIEMQTGTSFLGISQILANYISKDYSEFKDLSRKLYEKVEVFFESYKLNKIEDFIKDDDLFLQTRFSLDSNLPAEDKYLINQLEKSILSFSPLELKEFVFRISSIDLDNVFFILSLEARTALFEFLSIQNKSDLMYRFKKFDLPSNREITKGLKSACTLLHTVSFSKSI